jgi:hypothetical protein
VEPPFRPFAVGPDGTPGATSGRSDSDTANFDSTFTSEPPVLTPPEPSELAEIAGSDGEFHDFGFVKGDFLSGLAAQAGIAAAEAQQEQQRQQEQEDQGEGDELDRFGEDDEGNDVDGAAAAAAAEGLMDDDDDGGGAGGTGLTDEDVARVSAGVAAASDAAASAAATAAEDVGGPSLVSGAGGTGLRLSFLTPAGQEELRQHQQAQQQAHAAGSLGSSGIGAFHGSASANDLGAVPLLDERDEDALAAAEAAEAQQQAQQLQAGVG